MGRHTGPVERLTRRAGVDLELKGRRRLNGKGALERRGNAPPGHHGRRPRRLSVYGEQLRAKQALRHYYGVRERQLRRLIERAFRGHDTTTGEQLLALLETRLDNVVYRAGLAATRAQARQFVTHGHVLVDGRRCTIPSRRLGAGALVALRPGSPVGALADEAAEDVGVVPAWLQADHEHHAVRVLRPPARTDVRVPFDERLVVEYFSRR